MAYLLLLAFIFSVSFIFLLPSPSKSSRSAVASFLIGFILLALGFLTELVLGFQLNEDAARLFYWSRQILALAWFGHGVVLLLAGNNKNARWLTPALAAASLVSLILIAQAQVTQAEGWFQPGMPIFSQVGDLFATNRPTRWGAALLTAYGALSLIGGAIYFLVNSKKRRNQFWVLLLPLAAILYVLPIMIPPSTFTPLFLILELLLPFSLYFGITTLINSSGSRKRR